MVEKILFPDIKTVKKYIIEHSPFFDRLTTHDLIARKAQSIQHYKTRYIDAIVEFDAEERTILTDLARKADVFTKRYKLLYKDTPWNFVKLSGGIENGYPHTLEEFIMLPYDFLHIQKQLETSAKASAKRLVKTLIHEKIHVFQRKYPSQTRDLIESAWGFVPFQTEQPLKRTNPDTDDYIYKRGDSVCFQQYNANEHIRSLSDSRLSLQCQEPYEHPYEQMAYILSDILVENRLTTDDHIEALKWLERVCFKNT